MNISFTNQDNVNGLLEVKISKDDYQNKVDAALNEYRKKANIPGFRPGTAPMALIKKQVGNAILVEEVNKLVANAVYNYISENKLNVLGEPMPNLEKQKDIDWDKDEDFEFVFDLALTPEINIDLSKEDHLKYYLVDVDQKMMDMQVESIRNNLGTYKVLSEDAKSTDMIKGDIVELENGEPKEHGITVIDGVLMASYMKDKEEEEKFIGCKAGDVITFNPFKAYEGNNVELSSLLAIKKEEVPAVEGKEFRFTVKNISRYEKGELNQELFDKAFGKDVVKSEDEFLAKVKEQIQEQLKPESDYKFTLDASQLLLQKAGTVQFPADILQRWLVQAHKDNTMEKVKADYPKIEEDLKFHIIKSQIAKAGDLKVTEKDVMDAALESARMLFLQHGIPSVPQDMLMQYAQNLLKNEQQKNNLFEKALETKVMDYVKTLVTIDEEIISLDKFKEMFKADTAGVDVEA